MPAAAHEADKLSDFTSARFREGGLSGQPGARGGSKLANDVFRQHGAQATLLAGFSSRSIQSQWAILESMRSQLPRALVVPVSRVSRELDSLPWDAIFGALGDVVLVVKPHENGIGFGVETASGFLPPAVFIAAGHLNATPKNAEIQIKLGSIERGISDAQEAYLLREGRYALNLWELHESDLLSRELTSGISDAFIFRVASDGHRWHLEVRRDLDGATFRLDDDQQLVPLTEPATRRISTR